MYDIAELSLLQYQQIPTKSLLAILARMHDLGDNLPSNPFSHQCAATSAKLMKMIT